MHGRDIKVSRYPCPPPLARVLNEASAKNSNRNPFRTITYFVLTCILGNAARISEHARRGTIFVLCFSAYACDAKTASGSFNAPASIIDACEY